MMPPSLLDLVDEYLAFRRGLGFKLESLSWILRDFGRYADGIGHKGHITIDLAVRWALCTRSGDPAHAARRLSAVARFAQHRAVFDPATEVPPAGLLGPVSKHRKQPHIYSDVEITALLREAALLWPRNGLRPRTYVAFFSLLLSTGLRLSEACRLVDQDVDLAEGVLTVRESKFRKSRLVPLHPTTTRALRRYGAQCDSCCGAPQRERFFRTDRAPTLSRKAVHSTFSSLRKRLGWSAQGRARCPRIQDMRHNAESRLMPGGLL